MKRKSQHRARRALDYQLGHTTHQGVLKSGAAMCPENNEIDVIGPGDTHNLMGGSATDDQFVSDNFRGNFRA